MRTLTLDEITRWCARQKVVLDSDGLPVRPPLGTSSRRFKVVPDIARLTWFADFIERSLRPRNECLLWVISTGIWPNSENWHLYYRLRQSYADHRLMDEASGHLFLEYERADLVSFLEVGLVASWDMYLITGGQGYGRVFISHDEWIEFSMDVPDELQSIAKDLEKAGLLLS